MKKITKAHFYTKFILVALCVMGATMNTFAQCPTITNVTQTFCDTEVPVVANLLATDNGGGIKWYATATSTTPLSNTLGLVNDTSYFVDDNTGTCGSRQSVYVSIYGPPMASNFQGACVDFSEEATISDLSAVGNDVQWYTADAGGTPLPASTILSDNTFYYVDQSNPNTGCRTSRRSVFVNIGVVPIPTGDTLQTFCSDPQPTVADLVASGTNNWYSTLSSGSPLSLSTPLVDGESYYATTVDLPCESAKGLQVTVELIAPNNSGSSGEIEICESGVRVTGTVNLFEALLGTPDLAGTWSGPLSTSNGSTGTVDVTAMTSAGSPYVFTYAVSSASCPTSETTVSIFITESANPGTNGTLALCIDAVAHDLFKSLKGNPEPGGIWSPALASGNGFFNPAIDAPGDYKYTVQGVPPCGEESATVTVTINPEAQPGTDAELKICINSASVDLSESLGTHQPGGTWSPALASGTGLFNPAIDTAGVYTYDVSGITPCGNTTAKVTVTVIPLPNAGTNGSLTLCGNDAPHDLFDSLNGNPERGGTWSPNLTSTNGFFDPTKDAAGIYTYTVQGASPCGEVSATVTVTINPEAQPGTDNQLNVCFDSAPVDLSVSLGAHQAGGTWSPALSGGSGMFNPALDPPGIYTYSISEMTSCGNNSAKITVTIDQILNAGTNGQLEICSNDTPQDLFDSLEGAPDEGGTWSYNSTPHSGNFDPTKDNAGAYTYTVNNACGTDSAVITVAVIPQPNSTGLTLSANTICLDDALDVNLSGATQLANGNYNLSYALSGANTTEQTITVNITNGNANIVVPASLLTTTGTTTFTILNLLDPVTDCGTTSSTIPTVTFNIEEAATPQLVNDGNFFCETDAATIADLTSNLIGADVITWYDTLEDGTAYTENTLLVNGTTYYASNATTNGCGNGFRLAVTVTIDLCEPIELIIPDGFSPNGDNINDDFLIKNLRELYPSFKLQIYNRYGNILYKGDNNTPNWDGTSNHGREVGNGVLPVGVYYYILELNDTNNKTIQGSVYLNR